MKTYAIPVKISQVEGVGYRAECPGLQGCFVDGESLEEVLMDIQEAALSISVLPRVGTAVTGEKGGQGK